MRSKIINQYTEIPNNLFALLSRYRVVIPGIQRHYVQGAKNAKAESVRKQFIEEIFQAIEERSNLNLHFIYGPINTDGEDSFVPVDGQQRLTTLWLIARYAVEKADPTMRKELLRLLSRFTYEDRINAKRFCQTLTQYESKWNIIEDPNPNILCQDWFIDYWTKDETVASMIRMLSTIHQEWQKRTDSITAESVLESLGSTIKFGLTIDSFGDDIYMKMNARGLQLTQWENFKCKFSESLPKVKETWDKEMENLSNQYFICSGKQRLPDNSFFALYARMLVFRAKQCSNDIRQIANFSHNTWEQIELPFVPYSDFSDIIDADESLAEEVALTSIRMMKVVLNNNSQRVPYFGDRTLYETFFHPKNNNDLDFTLCCYEYFKKFKGVENIAFIQAMRLIWNILENVEKQSDKVYNRVDIVRNFIQVGDPSLYSARCETVVCEGDYSQERVEIEKAIKMYSADQSKPMDWNEEKLGLWIDWQHAINLAEETAFFNGSISFLYKNASGKTTWDNFATKLYNSKQLFSLDGILDDKKVIANKVLISHCKTWENIKRMPVFDAKKESWKRILTAPSLLECVNSLLLSPDEIVDNQDEIIRILMDDTIWTNLINETPGYELEWKANSPSLWLNRNLYQTLKLVRNNCENILDAFIGNPNIHFDTQDSNRYLQIRGVNYYYAIPIFFNYRYNEKEYHFAWQTWGWIDMYDRDIRLYDLYIEKFGEGFSIEIDKLANHDSSYYIGEIEKCIDRYEKFIAEHKGI